MSLSAPPSSVSFHIGQCWISEGEPELGIGFVRALDATSVALEFPSSTQARMYRKKTAPLKRLRFQIGERVLSQSGKTLVIERLEEREGKIHYIGKDSDELCESDLSPSMTLQRPIERFLSGRWDPLSSYRFRREVLERLAHLRSSPARGFMGPRAQLLPHQLYVARRITDRGAPRALLADEVGLGKTIEAAWIMHQLLVTGRIRRVLVLTPESLVNQWFVELFKRFNLSFWTPDSMSEDETALGIDAEDLESEERVILSHESLSALAEDGAFDQAKWDLIIVDEAHRIGWSPKQPSQEYEILSELAANSPGLLLLTATPEQLGPEGHFSRLHLLDPSRFPSYSDYLNEREDYLETAALAENLLSGTALEASSKKKLKSLLDGKVPAEKLDPKRIQENSRELALALIDHHGTGRIHFRNSRAIIGVENAFFPKRGLVTHEIEKGELVDWLAQFAKKYKKEKTLLIDSSAKRVTEWEKKLRDDHALKAVAFHERLSPIARDRNAAYFDAPDGASLLLCSEIGGEGRNFQAANRLILTDLPADPDVLEQRIGRLDRIGQRSDIEIHVPVVKGSKEALLLRWHNEVFDAFTAPPKGAASVYARYAEELEKVSASKLPALLKRAQKDYQEQLNALEEGRDRLVELNSFDPETGAQVAAEIQHEADETGLPEFVDRLLDLLKMDGESLDADTLFIQPGHSSYAAYFSGLPEDGQSFTFSRTKALARNDLGFLSWDHPGLLSAIEGIASQELGNVAIAAWNHPILAVECCFVLEPPAVDPTWFPDAFFPPTPIRIVLEATGKDLSSEWTVEKLQSALGPVSQERAAMIRRIPGEKIRGLLNQATRATTAIKAEAQGKAVQAMHAAIDAEIQRLSALTGDREGLSRQELDWWNQRKSVLTEAFRQPQLRLDSFLLITPAG